MNYPCPSVCLSVCLCPSSSSSFARVFLITFFLYFWNSSPKCEVYVNWALISSSYKRPLPLCLCLPLSSCLSLSLSLCLSVSVCLPLCVSPLSPHTLCPPLYLPAPLSLSPPPPPPPPRLFSLLCLPDPAAIPWPIPLNLILWPSFVLCAKP